MRQVPKGLCVVALAAAACAFARPALAGSGASHDVPLVAGVPTLSGVIDDSWDSADSFDVGFGSQTGTIKVQRSQTDLYVGVRVADTSAGETPVALYFDNSDSGFVVQGDDEAQIGADGTFLDQTATGTPDFAVVPDTHADGSAAHATDSQFHMAVFDLPLCSGDTSEDFCVNPPAFGQDAVRLGFTVLYGTSKYPVDPSNAAGYDNLVFEPPASAPSPPAPTIDMTGGDGFEQLALSGDEYTLYYNPSKSGQFGLVVPESDDAAGIVSASFPFGATPGWTTSDGASQREERFQFVPPDSGPPDMAVTSIDANEQTSPPRTVQFVADGQGPEISLECRPIDCVNPDGNVLVAIGAGDLTGVSALRYTTDGSDPASGGTPVAAGSTVHVATSGLFRLWASDGVGNSSEAQVNVNGTAAPTVLTWNYADDFQTDANPGRDLYGNPGVWSYGEVPVATQHDQSTATLYPNTGSAPAGGQDCWISSSPDSGSVPDDCVRTSSSPLVPDVDPGATRDTFVKWTSPITGTVQVSGGFQDLDANCGDGVDWFIDDNGTTLLSGSFPNGGSSAFDGTVSHVDVVPGDSLVFLVGPGPGGDDSCDSTAANITITQVPTPQLGPTLTVNATDDGVGLCSVEHCNLRSAISFADGSGQPMTIDVPTGEYDLTVPGSNDDTNATGDLDLHGNVTIDGPGATIVQQAGDRVLEVEQGATATLEGVTLTGGDACDIMGGVGVSGNGVLNFGTLTLDDVTIRNNLSSCDGGGIFNSGTLEVHDSTIDQNLAFAGSGIYNYSGQVLVTDSTINANQGYIGGGGGVYNLGQLQLVTSTIANNLGSGILNEGGSVDLKSSTVAWNTSNSILSGGLENENGLFTSHNSIVADNLGDDCQSTGGTVDWTSTGGHNLLMNNASCPFDTSAGNRLVANAQLGPLGTFGGDTQTVPLAPGSPAIDAGDEVGFGGADQRGIEADGQPDIGAFEFVPGAQASFTFSPPNPKDGQPVTFTSGSSTSNISGLAYWWDFGDGVTATESTETHTYSAPDTEQDFNVNLDVYDSEGGAAWASQTVPVVPSNFPPVASFTFAPTSPAPGQTVTFDGSGSSDQDGSIVDYHWSWGDDTDDSDTGDSASATHVFEEPGTYDVSLTVTDNGGKTNEITELITVGVQDIYVDASWAGLDDGTLVTGPQGQQLTIGTDAFSDVGAALGEAENSVPNTTVHVAAGTYDDTGESLFIDKNGDQLVGDGSSVTHLELSTLEIDSSNNTVSGLDIVGRGPISDTGGCSGCEEPVILVHGDDQFDGDDVPQAATIADNRISGGSSGIYLAGETQAFPSSGNLIARNEIFDNGVGVTIDSGANNVVEQNTIHDNLDADSGSTRGSSGVAIVDEDGAGPHDNSITGNEIFNSVVGIYSDSGANGTIFDNTIHDTGSGSGGPQAAIVLDDSFDDQPTGNEILENTISASGNHGISVRTSGNMIEDNTITNSGTKYKALKESSGIELVADTDDADDNVISGNTISGSAFAGIKLGYFTTDNTINGNAITGTLHGGADGESDPGAGGSGILLTMYGAEGTTITSNTIDGNAGHAIYIEPYGDNGAGDNAAHENSFTNNALGGVQNLGAQQFDATHNWWGDASGPSGAGPGNGQSVSTNVLFDPFLTSAPGSSLTQQTTTSIGSGENPSNAGDTVRFSASVRTDTGIVSSGTVEFSVDGTPVDTEQLNSDGFAEYSTSALTTGTHTVTASFLGNDSFSPSTDSLSQTVNGSTAAPPEIDDVELAPQHPLTNGVITATPTAHDADGGPISFAYQWFLNGVLVSGATGPTYDLSQPGNGGRGDAISVAVTPSEGTLTGDTFTTDPVIVGDTAPVVDSVEIDSSASPVLKAIVAGHDDDGDDITYAYQWLFDGDAIQGATGQTLDLSQQPGISRGNELSVQVTPSDGTLQGDPVTSSTIAVPDQPPSVTSLKLSPAQPLTNGTVTASVATSDPDNDDVSVAFQWLVNGKPVPDVTGPTLDLSPSGHGDRGDQIAVIATPNDGTLDGAAFTSDAVTVADTAPVMDSTSIELLPGGILQADTTSHDDDGDAVTYAYQWSHNGNAIQGATGKTLDLSTVQGRESGDSYSVFATPSDGTLTGTPLGAAIIITSTPQLGPVFTVTTSADHEDATGCTVEDCTLREAITAANDFDGQATIDFAIPLGVPTTIRPTSPLPAITNAMTIDGTTQPGSLIGPAVQIDGSLTTGDGLDVSSSLVAIADLDITGFSGNGIAVSGGVTNIGIVGDWLGIAPDGTTPAGNGGDGLFVQDGAGVTIASVVASGNGGHGVELDGVTKVTIRSDLAGTNASGTGGVPNGLDGFAAFGGSGITFNGVTAAGNGHNGISLSGNDTGAITGVSIQGSSIGIGRDGVTRGLANGGDGIHLSNAVNTRIGGTTPNTIGNNKGDGVDILGAGSVGNDIDANSIVGDGGLGIDLGGDGVTKNDSGDGDSGPNDLVNFPVLAPLVTGGAVNVNGRLVAAPNTTYRIDVYANATCSPSGFGEGQTFETSGDVTTDATGVAGIPIAFQVGAAVPAGVTLTATDTQRDETSEFSQCQKPGVSGATTSGTVTLSANAQSTPAGASIVTLANIPRDAFSSPAPTAAPIDSAPIDSAPIDSAPIDSAPIDSAPIDSAPIDSAPIDSAPIDSAPIDSAPIDSAGLTAANLQQAGLGGVPLSELPLLNGKTWAAVLGRDLPLQATTLAQAIALVPDLGGLTFGDVDWAHSTSALASVGVGAFAVGSAALSDIRPLSDWCTAIAAIRGFGCTDPSSLAGKTVMDIALEGIPIDSAGLGSAPIDSASLKGTPIDSAPIDSADIAGTPIDSAPLSEVDMTVSVLGGISLKAVVAAGSPLGTISTSAVPAADLACAGSGTCGATLASDAITDAAKVRDLGAALNGFTIGDLKTYPGVTFGNIGPGLPPTITLNDLLRAYFAQVPFDPSTMPLDGIQTIADPSGRNAVTYTAQITLQGSGNGLGYAELRAIIDPSARYVPGSTTVTAAGSTTPLASNDPGLVDGQLAWALNGLTYGTTYTLTFQVYAGLQLGTDRTSVTLLPAGAPSSTATPVTVGVTDTFEGGGGNNTPSTATPVQAGKLYLSFEQTQGDTDWYALPVPAAGTVSTITLSHLTNDKDLIVYAPSGQQLRSAPIDSSPIDSAPIDSAPVLDPQQTITQATDSLAPAGVQDVPIDQSLLGSNVVAGISDNAGTADDSVSVVSNGGGGSYLIHVVDSDSVPTTSPYVLDIAQDAPAPPAPCPTSRTFPSTGAAVAAVSPTSAPSARTLILVDYKRYGDTYGAAAEARLQTKLNALATQVGGLVVPVEDASGVQTAYNTWDSHTCDPEAANGVVRAIISAVVDPFHASHANAKFLVIVGSDAIVPFPRVPDETTTSNERDYVSTIGFPTGAAPTNNELVGTAVDSYMETDDVWSAFNPVPFLEAPLYVPQWATGRLVETPAQIEHQLDTFAANGGALTPTTAFTAGYGFLADSAQAVATSLAPIATAGGPGNLISDTWTRSDLLGKLQLGNASSPQIVTLNGHFDHSRALPAGGAPLFTTGDVSSAGSNAELGRLIFSIGCHSGYSVPDELYAAGSPFALDWPEVDFSSGAVARVANTTYGYGDTDTIGYSEAVEVDFVHRLSQMTLGEALLYAKQQYIADLGSVGPFEQKSVNALTFYGLPMQHIGPGTTPTAPTPPTTTTTDPATGLPAVQVTSNVTFGAPVNAPSGGQYFNGPDGIDATNNRPFEPKKIIPNIGVPGLLPHGFLITGLSVSTPLSGFQPARSRAVPDSASLTPTLQSDVGWPSSLARISSFATPNGPEQQLVLLHGQFLSDPASSTGTGTQTNFSSINGSILYSTSTDALPPQLANIHVTQVPTGVAFEVDATDATSVSDTQSTGTVKEIVVVYFEPGTASTAHVVTLTQTPGTHHWSGAGPSAGPADSIEYFMQAVDAAGNVGLSVHKVVAAPIVLTQSGQSNLAITPGGPPPSGWFNGTTPVSISADPGTAITYSLDGGPVTSYTGPFPVSGDGVHVVDAFSDDGAGHQGHVTAAIPIDTLPPTISIASPVDTQYTLVGSVLKASFSCSDAGSGLAATNGCVGTVANGAKVDTSTAGVKTFTVTARDAATPAHTATQSVTYTVWKTQGDAVTALVNKTLADLKAPALKPVLQAFLTTVANAIIAKNPKLACATLDLYIAAVNAAPSSALTAAQKADLVGDAKRIKTLIGC